MVFPLLVFSLAFLNCSDSSKGEPTVCPPAPPNWVISLKGDTLMPPVGSEKSLSKKDSLLGIALANYGKDPKDLNNTIWLGRRWAYKWYYREAINIYTKGIELHPEAPELYRHRGHRYISARQLDKAIADFEQAAELAKDRELEIEPDGLPNHLNKPLTNLHGNIYYHLGLAYYLKGDFEKAAETYEAAKPWDMEAVEKATPPENI